MVNKEQIMKTINDYNLDKSQFVVLSGASLVLQDVIEYSNDIDISSGLDYYNYLLENFNCKYELTNEFGKNVYTIDGIINFGLSYLSKETVEVEGIKCASIKDVLELKKYLNREKDNDTIKLLEKILREQ